MIDNNVYKNLNDFLAKHNTKHAEKNNDSGPCVPSHTRIPDVKTKIYGGSYLIPKDHISAFYELYYRDVIVGNKPEYLTEKQIENGPLLIDIDLRYHYDVETRQHTQQHVVDLLTLVYLEELKDFLVLEPNKPFPVFVFEKPDVNRLADGSVTKDGIHIIVGVQMDHALQLLLRERVVEKIKDYWDLPIINSWEAVFDEGISKGTTNWQMFGSRKPNHQRYEWTQHYQVTFDNRDGEIMFEEQPITPKLMESLFPKMMAQYEDHVRFEMQPKWKSDWEAVKERGSLLKTKREGCKQKIRLLSECADDETVEIRLEDIVSQDKLEAAMDKILGSLSVHEYHVREAHEFTQILPAKYYEPGSHLVNRQVAFALKHTDERLFLSWVMLRSKASDFDYCKIPELYFQWTKHFKQRENGVTARSIMYWAKQDVPELYESVKKNTRDYYIEQTLTSPTEFDFALVLYQMFRDKYVCSNLTSKTWYVFKDHRWEIDRGQSLRKSISVEMYAAYQDKISTMLNDMQNYGGDDDRYKTLREMVKKATEMSMRLKKTTDKNNIMREAEVLFYDGDFERNIDSNKWLLCFKNGVVDLKNCVFRNGSPQDYLSKSTNVVYEPLDREKETTKTKMSQIKTFMSQLFPDPGLNQYMWEHLGSTLIGENKNQCFNIYRGSGSNGKSILTDLMEKALGDYYGTVPVTLVTEKRPGIGGPTSELIQLKGVRYAVMQEPSKDAKINEGMMKQLTGDSKLSGRALYHEQETFMIQFHLVVCTNSLFEINSNDDGTWRRIRICDFLSKFVDEDAPPLQNVPYQFVKDKHLKDKLDDWTEVFVAMLVERAFANQGLVEKCDMVKESSNKYRQGQDHIAAFVDEKVGKQPGGFIKKSELCEQFKLWFQEEEGGNRKLPKPTELYEFMEIKFGKAKRGKKGMGWSDMAILYQYEEEEADVIHAL